MLSNYQRRFGFDAYERAQRMYATAVPVPPPKPPSYARHVGRTLLANGTVHLIESQRVRGRMYRVTAGGDGTYTCTCPDYTAKAATDARYQCKHVYVVRTDERNGARPRRRL